jgi:hypothetical protein
MTIVSSAREADRVAGGEAGPGPVRLELVPVTGAWVSATGLAGGISWVQARQRDGALLVSARGRGEPGPGTWGEARAHVFASALRSADGYAFITSFERERARSHLQTYQGLGVLVVHAFHQLSDDGHRPGYFTREFYVPAGPASGPVDDNGGPADAVPARTGTTDPAGLLGSWHCLAPAVTKSIATLTCFLASGQLMVRAAGVGATGPVDWGESAAQPYADAHYLDNPPAFLATFDHGYMRVHLQARVNRGVLVVGEYTEFTDASGRSDYFIRESFRR